MIRLYNICIQQINVFIKLLCIYQHRLLKFMKCFYMCFSATMTNFRSDQSNSIKPEFIFKRFDRFLCGFSTRCDFFYARNTSVRISYNCISKVLCLISFIQFYLIIKWNVLTILINRWLVWCAQFAEMPWGFTRSLWQLWTVSEMWRH